MPIIKTNRKAKPAMFAVEVDLFMIVAVSTHLDVFRWLVAWEAGSS